MDFDGYCDFSSDDEDNFVCISHYFSSSEDEDEEKFCNRLAAFTAHNKDLCRQKRGPSSLDDFEEEMAGELDKTMAQFQSFVGPSSTSQQSESGSNVVSASNSIGSRKANLEEGGKQYDSIYFDSDDDEDDAVVRRRRAKVTDDDLFYDPNLDDEDQQWMDKHRARAHCRIRRKHNKSSTNLPAGKKENASHKMKLPESDAVLNCPGCLTMLCADCQRHEVYSNQYRAMFVFRCKVDTTQLLKFPTKLSKKEMFKRRKLERKLKKQEVAEQSCSNIIRAMNNTESVSTLTGGDNKLLDALQSDIFSNVTKSMSVNENIAKENSNSTTDDFDKTSKRPVHSIAADLSVQSMNTCSKKVKFADEDVNESESYVLESTSVNSSPVALLQSTDEEMFHPVMCEHCNTKVAVIDKDEVYHFFNVVTSY